MSAQEVPALRATGAGVAIGGVDLLRPVSLSVERGEFLALEGPNGSGKTTLLRAFLGRTSLSSGSCSIFGRAPSRTDGDQRRQVAALVDSVPVARDMTVREQLLLVAASWFGRHASGSERVERTLERLGIHHLAGRFPHELSSGQFQLMSLGMVLSRPLDVLLLDEPERHLDADRSADLAGLLADLASTGTAVLAATHDPSLMAASDTVVALP